MASSRSGSRSWSRRSRARWRSARATSRRSWLPDLSQQLLSSETSGRRAQMRPAGRLPSGQENRKAGREERPMAPSPFEDEHAPLYTVGQVAEMLAVKQAFLRRVDELRVVSPRRSAGGQRRYTRYEIRVIQQVVSMADEGITLQAIRRIIDLEQQLAAMTNERDELARRLAELAGLAGLAERLQREPR